MNEINNTEDDKAFVAWFDKWKKENKQETPLKDEHYNLARESWLAAVEYVNNKPVRTYRWDGVIR
jgi:hypothetical protein